MDYNEFVVSSPMDGTRFECRFSKIIVGIAPRHSDSVDVKFLVNGRPVWVAVPLPALAELGRRNRQALSDPEVIELAALSLRKTLENEGVQEDRMIVPSDERIIALAEKLTSSNGAPR
ncbi:MAG: hypothetical protein HYX72_02920 [Acidobacteria bacterium]|nr:hypothetical protein [Acidobacteriota bacterium]